MHLDHFTIRTALISETRDFFRDVFGLVEGDRPALIRRIPGSWLYAGDRPIVHIIRTYNQASDRAAEAIDHVGLRLEGYHAFRSKLEGLGIHYSTMDLPDLQERRLFFCTPGGTLLEAVFSEPTPLSQETSNAVR